MRKVELVPVMENEIVIGKSLIEAEIHSVEAIINLAKLIDEKGEVKVKDDVIKALADFNELKKNQLNW